MRSYDNTTSTRVDGGSDEGGSGTWTLDAGCWMVDAARGMAVHEVVDFTRSIAEPAAPPPYARVQAHSKKLRTLCSDVFAVIGNKSNVFWHVSSIFLIHSLKICRILG